MISRPGGSRPIDRAAAEEIVVAGESLLADCNGALYWPREGVLAVADLHLEKGSSFARRGVLLLPYDTAATLGRLALVVTRYTPRVVIALGDSFHDDDGAGRVAVADRTALAALQRGRDWIWIVGNHDRRPADGVGGCAGAIAIDGLMFRHEPTGTEGEIAGHLHPVARASRRGQTVSRRCFAADRTRLIMPAFGAFAGGLNVRHRAFADIFGTLAFTAHLLGEGRLYALAASRCLRD
jgi:DNA ligase-associated metallophosphoesterase